MLHAPSLHTGHRAFTATPFTDEKWKKVSNLLANWTFPQLYENGGVATNSALKSLECIEFRAFFMLGWGIVAMIYNWGPAFNRDLHKLRIRSFDTQGK